MQLNKADREIPIISVDRPTKMTASTKFKTLEKKFLRSVKNQALMKRSQAQVKTLTFEESILPLSGVVPVTEEQEPAEHPETKEQENVPE